MRSLPPTDFAAIRRAFGFSAAKDRAAADRLAQSLSLPPYDTRHALAKVVVEGNDVYVLGAADDARAAAARVPPEAILWTADGATTAALEAGRQPSVVVTDLDGRIADEARAADEGAAVFVHAHGDNGTAIARWLKEFPSQRIIGTCQVEPPPGGLINVGGFTDGDRAVHLALACGAASVTLVGFDFSKPGPYSGRKDPAQKIQKLAWAKRLVDGLIAAGEPVRFG